ncbi:protein Wiz isoform X7 [Petaurus breviceps papuanus]|uniref:protein Wiz isoform X7 n=1 Tax=Petaurus breviceps papuanus TaxID=3040969 RepID=UPI0036DAF794
MEGPPGGGTAPPPRPAASERPPSLVLRSESEEDVEAEDGEEGSPVATLYPPRPPGPRSMEGLRDPQDNDGVTDGPPHHGLGDTLPSASAATTAHRSSSRYRDGGGAEFPLGSPPLLLLGRFPSPSDGRGSRAPWERPLCVDRGADVREESTLERPSSSREAGAPFCSQEASFVSESKAVHTVKTHTELGGGPELRGAPEIAAESPVPLGSWEDRHPPSEPKPLDTFHREHLSKNKKGILRFDWFSDPDEHAHYREKGQGLDSGVGQSMRVHPLREAAPPLALPGFRKSPAPGLGKIRTLEAAVVTERKGLVAEPEVSERSPLPEPRPEWVLPRPSLQAGPELAISKQTWTVNEEDSVERLSLEPPPCGPYDIEMRPYFCNLVEEAEKEALGPEEDPAVYTCIECSIYFKKKEHLLDHMMQHSRGPGQDPAGDSRGGQGQFSCSECGWAFGDPGTLEQHRRLHQESREKIIEEIQKLNEFPDEGRDARLQCPKCLFGTNSSKIFVQHAKMHVRERRDQGPKSPGLSGHSGGEAQDSPGHLAYKHFRPNEPPIAQGPSLGLGKGLHSCILCGFPAPNENVLKEHVKYAHSHQPWGADVEAFEDSASQPGTSRDTYSPARLARMPDVDYFGKAERLFAPAWQEGSAHYDPTPAFALGHHRLDRSGRVKKGFSTASFHSRKMLPYGSTHKTLGTLPFSSAKVYNPYALHPSKKKSMAHLKDLESDMCPDFLTGWEELRPLGSYTSEMGSMEEEMSLTTEIDFPQNRSFNPITIPHPALELKRTFRDALQKAESSETQQHQLRKMVPIVLVEEMNLQPPRGAFQAHGRMIKAQGATSSTELMLDGPIPLDLLLLDSPLEGPLGIDDLFDSDSPMLKNEERKCPYCPDRFHNGIGLANHVRGHLNRVGVSYNVRHFISAEEVKAIEQKFSFQKKKKKGIANFDPSTFSLMRCEFCGAGFDTRAGLSSHARAHLRDFGITNWELTISPINILKELLAASAERPVLVAPGPGEPGSPGCERDILGFGPPSLMTMSECRGRGSPLSPFPQAWGDELGPIYRDVLASEEEEMVAVELASPPLPKKSALPPGQLEQTTSRLGNKMSPEIPHGSKQEPPDLKALDSDSGRELDCQLCGAWFETRKGLSSHARAHLRHLGVSDPDAKGSPIDVLHELIKSDGFQTRLPTEREVLAEPGRSGLSALRPSATALSLLSPPPAKKPKPRASGEASLRGKQDLSASIFWASDVELSPLNLSSGPEPVRDIRCEFCGEFFENRKGLSSHARSHLRQMGVTEWYVNGSPIDTLREILKRRTQPRAGGPPNPTLPGPKGLGKAMGGGPGGSLEARSASELHVPPPHKKLQSSSSPLGHSPTTSPPPTARKMFPGLPPPSLQKKLKPDQMRMEIKREMLAGSLHSEGHPSDGPWSPREDMAPLNLSSRAEPVRDIRCEFCGEFFENRKGLSSHARSHLRQMGVTEWSVNGSPIDTLREILKKKAKPCLIKKEPAAGELSSPLGEDGPKSPGKVLQALSLTPLAGRPGKPGPGSAIVPREMNLSPLATKPSTGFLTPMAAKRPLPEDRLLSGEMKPKTYIQTELPFKTKTIHDKSSHTSSEACCELCGLYFENRKALASHARAHLRQFGVTEWCVNGSPIETLSEWIKHRPQKVGAYRSYIQGGRPFTKKFRNSGHGRDGDKRMPLTFAPNSLTLVNKNLGGELGPGEAGRIGDGGERPLASSPLALVKAEEHQRQNINKFERRQARPLDTTPSRGEEASDFQQKLEEVRQPPPRVRPVPSLVPRPPQTSLVKFVGNIYTLKCRFCEVEFQGPLSIQEEWVRHLQRHILEMNFSKAEPRPVEPEAPEAQTVAEAQ